MARKPLETLLALKAISLEPGLTSNERRVGAALIEHFNRRTGQCDPGLGRLSKLLGIDKRTVIRSIDGLGAAGMFKKTRHGGHSNRNSYEPIWSRFEEICVEWNARLRNGRLAAVTELSLQGGQTCRIEGGAPATQTCQTNLQTLTCTGLPTKQAKAGSTAPSHSVRARRPRDAAESAAECRWTRALHERFVSTPVTYGEVLGLITPELQSVVTKIEMERPGTGFNYLLEQLAAHPVKAASCSERPRKQTPGLDEKGTDGLAK
jgi:DNA-binding IclR family transcriptional regulator